VFAQAHVSSQESFVVLSPVAFLFAMAAMTQAPAAGPTSSPANVCPGPPTSQTLLNPPDIFSKDGVLNLTLSQENVVRGSTTVMCWVYRTLVDGKMTALATPPTLNVKQGERLDITLLNDLSYIAEKVETPPPLLIGRDESPDRKKNPYALMCDQPQLAPTPTPDPVTGRIYGYHRSPWNEANLHFHGLNTSPKQPGDNTTDVLLCPHARGAVPGTYHYVVDIPKDEPPGTYWYHPHPHGESLYQIFLGMTGAIVVHSASPSIPDRLPNHIVVIRDKPAHPKAISPYNDMLRAHFPNLAQIRMELAKGVPNFVRGPGGDPFQPPDACPPRGGSGPPTQTDSLTVNGLPLPLVSDAVPGLPTASIGLGETQYWRLANTSANTTLDLVLLVNGKATPLMVTSRDGVPLVTKNGQPTWQPVAMNDVFLMPASRVEFYLKGEVPGANMVVRTRTVDTGCVGDSDLARNLVDVIVGSKGVIQHVALPPAYRAEPLRFSDLAAQTPTKPRTFVLTEYTRTDEPEPDFYITETSNPKAIEHPYAMEGPADVVVKDGTVEEWTILNYTDEIHAFHIHQIHFMPMAGVDMARGLGQLLDTVDVPHGVFVRGKMVPGRIKLRMDFRARDIVGTFVYHCHIMEHEDAGMMAKIKVVP
jgi:FtsP/CotA-like multicopper oxidase with cupredoxin domain